MSHYFNYADWYGRDRDRNQQRRTWTFIASTGVEPLTLSEAKQHLGIETSETRFDTEVGDAIKSARAYCERRAHWIFSESVTFQLTQRTWPLRGEPLRLYFPPLLAVDAFTYVDDTDNVATVAPANYVVQSNTTSPSMITFPESFSRPTLSQRDDALRLLFRAGFGVGNQSSVDPQIKLACKWMLNVIYDAQQDERKLKGYYDRIHDVIDNVRGGYVSYA